MATVQVNNNGQLALKIEKFEEILVKEILDYIEREERGNIYKARISCDVWFKEEQLASHADLIKSYWSKIKTKEKEVHEADEPKADEPKADEPKADEPKANQSSFDAKVKDVQNLNKTSDRKNQDEEEKNQTVLQPSKTTKTPTAGRKKRIRKVADPSTVWRSKRLKENDEKLASSSFHCNECKKSFHREDIYVAHMLDHDQFESPTMITKAQVDLSEDLFEVVTVEENKRTYQCRLCDHVFLDAGEAKLHQRVHDGSSPLYCGQCDKHFVRRDKYTKHLETHKGMKSFQCDTCGKCFASLDSVSKHRINSCNKRSALRCSTCAVEFEDKASLEAHEPCLHGGQVEFRCEPCGETFSVKTVFEEHLRSHEMPTLSDQYTCSTCGVHFGSKNEYEEHVKSHDFDIYRCHSCNETYNLLEDLEMHYQMSETCLEVVCTDCNGEFQCVSDLRKHLQDIRKTGDEDQENNEQLEVFICRFCQRGFHHNDPLLLHLKVHYSQKPKPCEICQKSFDTEQKLRIHYKVSHGETAKFPCIECGSIFNEKSQLKKHTKIEHASESIFKCLPCGRTFYQKFDFNKHVITKQHHKRVVEAGLADDVQGRLERVRCPICEKVFASNRELKRHQYQHQRIQSKAHPDRIINTAEQQSSENMSLFYNEPIYNFVDGEHVVLTTGGEQQAAPNIMNINIDSAGNIGLVYVKRTEGEERKVEISRKESDALSALMQSAEGSGLVSAVNDKGQQTDSIEECNEETFLALSEMVKQGKIDLSSLEVIEEPSSSTS